MMSSPLTTVREAIRRVLQRFAASITQRPLRAGDLQPEGSLAPIPAPIPEPSENIDHIDHIDHIEDGVPNPAEQLSSVLIPMPPPPRCQYPSEYSRGWMLSHRWEAAVGHLVCQDCAERWPKPREEH